MSPAARPGTPPAEFEITTELVRRLLEAQVPHLGDQPITPLSSGWDNEMFRVGDDHLARLPRRALGGEVIELEQRWLPVVAPTLPLDAPVPLHVGQPQFGYPWRWSVVHWVDGGPGDQHRPDPSAAIALADFMRALHQPAPPDAPHNPFRGLPLPEMAERIEALMVDLAVTTDLVTDDLRRAYARSIAAPQSVDRVWLHGDMHPRNIIVRSGKVASVVDWGDMCAGDGATDLATFWMLFEDPEIRRGGLDHYGADAAMVDRARGWAIHFGLVLVQAGLVDDPLFVETGSRSLRAAAHDMVVE